MLELRRFEAGDAAEVWELHNLAIHDDAGYGPWDQDLGSIRASYLDDGGEFLVGLVDGRVVAMGALRRLNDSVAEVKRMRVNPRFQRRGFGRLVLGRLERRAVALAQTSLTIPGAPGYTTFTGPDGEALPVGRPWVRSCRPIRFAFGKGVPGWVQTQAKQFITEARAQGIDVTVENPNYTWSLSSLYYRSGQSWKTSAEVGIFASNGLPPVLTNGHLEHIGLGWNARQDRHGHNEDLTSAQGILQLRVLTSQPQVVRLSFRQPIAMTQGILATTQQDCGIADGSTTDQFTPADVVAMKRMSGCG